MVYFICFFVSVLFAQLAKRSRRRSVFILFSVVSVAITSVLAGLRDVSIGIDTQNYYESLYSWAGAVNSSSLAGYLEFYFSRYGGAEVLFRLLVGAVAQLTGNYNAFLFVVHLIIMVGVYIGAFRMREHADPVFTLLLFYFLYYNHSLNIYRQYMAMAVIFAAAADIEQGKDLRYLFFVAVATMLHSSGLLGIAPLLVYRVLYPKRRFKSVSLMRRVIICILIICGACAFIPFVRLLISVGLLSSKYLYYLSGEDTSSYLLVRLFLMVEVFGFLLYWKKFRRNNVHADFFMFCSLTFMVLYILASSIVYGKRIAAYFSFLNIVSLGMLVNCQKKRNNRRFVGFAIFVTVLVYWLYAYVYRNASDTMPYVLGVRLFD